MNADFTALAAKTEAQNHKGEVEEEVEEGQKMVVNNSGKRFKELKLFNLGKLKEATSINELEMMYHSGQPIQLEKMLTSGNSPI